MNPPVSQTASAPNSVTPLMGGGAVQPGNLNGYQGPTTHPQQVPHSSGSKPIVTQASANPAGYSGVQQPGSLVPQQGASQQPPTNSVNRSPQLPYQPQAYAYPQ